MRAESLDSQTTGSHEVTNFDYAAHTPIDPRVLDILTDAYRRYSVNPNNTGSLAGRQARQAIENARASVASFVGAEADEIVFTSGATESNNLALLGAYQMLQKQILSPCTEHPSVLECCRALKRRGAPWVELRTDRFAGVDFEHLHSQVNSGDLISLLWVNNELGTVNDIEAIGELTRARGALFHSDATQAVARLPIRVKQAKVDLMSFSGHKLYGPTGIGALYVRRGVELEPLFHGGGERFRPGTPATPEIVAFALACTLAAKEMAARRQHLSKLTDRFLTRLRARVSNTQVWTPPAGAVPGLISIAIPGVEAEALQLRVPEFALATGTACSTGITEPSHVLRALELPGQLLLSTFRFSFGADTTADDIDRVIDALARETTFLRSLA